MFTEEQKEIINADVEERVAKKRKVQAVTNAKGDYERAQAAARIKDMKDERLRAYADEMKAAGISGWEYSEKVKEHAAKYDDDYKSSLLLEDQLKKGELADAAVLNLARQHVKERQDKEDAQYRATIQHTVSLEIYKKLDAETRKAMGLTGNQEHDLVLIAHELFGMKYVQMGPDGVILTQGSFSAKARFNEGLDRGKYAEYGNNYFMLYTYYPGFKGFLTADGVMQEMPAISMSTEWENSPAASVGEELDKALNNEFLEFCAMKTTNANTPIMRRKDALTSRCYKDTGDISFQLKFRVYPGQKVGTQALTTVQEWLLLLSMTTPINAACSFNVTNAIGTVVKAADGIAAAFKAVKDSISGTNTKDEDKNKNKDGQQHDAFILAESTIGDSGTALTSFEDADARITNPNVFGACLFGIRLYPWIFKKPLTCYISSWSVTPSKEWNNDRYVNDHYYYDFTLNCSMDQKPCANTWRTDYFKV